MSLQSFFNDDMKCVNENKYFIGFAVILLNIGARFIIDELDDDLRSMVNDKIVRRFFIFCSFFLATRDIVISITLTVVFIIIINEFLGKEKEVKENNTSNSNKKELEKTINSLKQIQLQM